MNIPEYVTLDTLTKTPISYRNRITFEFCVYGFSVLLNFFLCTFFICRSHFFHSFKPTIFFVTFGTFILSLPLFFLQSYLVISLWFQIEPEYTVAVCTFVKCITSATTSCAQVLPLPVSIYRYFIVVRNQKLSCWLVIFIHIILCCLFVVIAILNFPFGKFEKNDQCEILQFSKIMEAIRIGLTLGLNLVAVFINVLIYCFVQKYDKRNVDVHRRRVQLTYSMLLQSIIPVLVSIPLLVGSFQFYFGIKLPDEFTDRWYATTFLSPFLTPISSMLSLRAIRNELFAVVLPSCICSSGRKISNMITSKASKIAVMHSSDYLSA